LVGVMFSGVILQAIDGATSSTGSSKATLSRRIYRACINSGGNVYLSYSGQEYEGQPIQNALIKHANVIYNSNVKVLFDMEKLSQDVNNGSVLTQITNGDELYEFGMMMDELCANPTDYYISGTDRIREATSNWGEIGSGIADGVLDFIDGCRNVVGVINNILTLGNAETEIPIYLGNKYPSMPKKYLNKSKCDSDAELKKYVTWEYAQEEGDYEGPADYVEGEIISGYDEWYVSSEEAGVCLARHAKKGDLYKVYLYAGMTPQEWVDFNSLFGTDVLGTGFLSGVSKLAEGHYAIKVHYSSLGNIKISTLNKLGFMKLDVQVQDNSDRLMFGQAEELELNYFHAIVATVMIIYAVFHITFGLIKRIFMLLVLYVTSPIFLSMYPFDNGSAFGSWRKEFISYTIGAWVSVGVMNLYIQLLAVIDKVTVSTSSVGFNAIINLVILVVSCLSIKTLISTFSGWVGAKDLHSEGKNTAKEVSEPIKKVAGTALAIAGTVAGFGVGGAVAAKAASAARKKAMSDKGSFLAMDADQREEYARDKGFASAGDYESSLDKTISENSGARGFVRGVTGGIKKKTDKMARSGIMKSFYDAYDEGRGKDGAVAYEKIREEADKGVRVATSAENIRAVQTAFVDEMDIEKKRNAVASAESEVAKAMSARAYTKAFDELKSILTSATVRGDVSADAMLNIDNVVEQALLGNYDAGLSGSALWYAQEAYGDFRETKAFDGLTSAIHELTMATKEANKSAIRDASGNALTIGGRNEFETQQYIATTIMNDIKADSRLSDVMLGDIGLLKPMIESKLKNVGADIDNSKNAVDALVKIINTQIKPIIDKTQQKVNDMQDKAKKK
ncbi:MAG: hypothetical protein ACLRFG_03635, partial [Clostridia bacterium]